ncbi:MAG TPA: hypothetical protein VE596_12195 [Gaiellaceae bacterium]|jgi:hypothetical protein|nr:hypothetical protein [Gaiellaceae bacterium]
MTLHADARRPDAAAARTARLRHAERWRELVDTFLPLEDGDSPWRFSRVAEADDPPQGFKLHVSATVLDAVAVMEACAPLLASTGTLFKAVASLDTLGQLNSGLRYGFSQVGKFMTVYPKDPEDAVRLAAELDRRTAGLRAPPVPYDLPYRDGGCVYYRYGGFAPLIVEESDGFRSPAIRDPTGKFVPDQRLPGKAVPDWIVNPFDPAAERFDSESPLLTQVLVYDILSQRGKGGVYRGVDIRETPATYCIVKEGRLHGETGWNGIDGRGLILHEERVLRQLPASVAAAEVRTAFDVEGHRYLVLEHIEGEPLVALCMRPRAKLRVEEALAAGAAAARVVARIHAAGWAWRDCKPANLMLTPEGAVRPLDFEGAVQLDDPCDEPYGTPAFTPPELRLGAVTGTNLPEDLYALGATIYQLLTSFQPDLDEVLAAGTFHDRRRPLGTLRKGVPRAARALVAALLDADPLRRPEAAEAAATLERYAGSLPAAEAPVRRRPRRSRQDPEVERLPGRDLRVVRNPRPRRRLAVAA